MVAAMDSSPQASPPISIPRAVATLGVTQTIAFACSFYLPAPLAKDMAAGVGVGPSVAFLAFSAAMLIQPGLAPWIGRIVDQRGARGPLAASSVILAVGLVGLGAAQNAWQLVLAWLVIGLGMAAGLYDVAFAGLVGWFGQDARRGLTGVTLIAGFASTVGWPLTAWIQHSFDWRAACFAWAALNLAIALPLHLSLPRGASFHTARTDAESGAAPSPRLTREAVLLATAFAAMSIIGATLSAHLPLLLAAFGVTTAAAIAAGALVGPSQVAARVAEFALVRSIHPLVSGRAAVAMFPIAAALILTLGAPAAAPFVVLYGCGNGLFTIVRGSLPLAMFGPQGYGARLGVLNVPARILGAVSPFVFALVLERSAPLMVAILGALGLSALACLLALRRPEAV